MTDFSAFDDIDLVRSELVSPVASPKPPEVSEFAAFDNIDLDPPKTQSTDEYETDPVTGLPITRQRQQFFDNKRFGEILRQVAKETDRRQGVADLAALTGTDFDYVDKNYDEVKSLVELDQDPERFRSEHPHLFKMVMLNPSAARTVLRNKELPLVSAYIREALFSPTMDLRNILYEANPMLKPVVAGFKAVGRAAGIIETKPTAPQEYTVSEARGFGKYYEALQQGILQSGIAPYVNAVAESLQVMGATGAASTVRMKDSDFVSVAAELQHIDSKILWLERNQPKRIARGDSDSLKAIEAAKDARFEIQRRLSKLQKKVKPLDWGEGPAEALVLEGLKASPTSLSGLLSMGVGGLVGGLAGLVLPGSPAMYARGGAYLTGFGSAYRLESSASWPEMRDLKNDAGEQIDRYALLLWNNLYGVFKAGVEVSGDSVFITKALGVNMGKAVAKQSAAEATKELLKSRGLLGKLTTLAKGTATGFATDGFEEAGQEALDIAAKWSAESHANRRPMPLDLEDAADQIVRAGMVGAAAGGGMGLFTFPFRVAKDALEYSKVVRAGAIAAGLEELSGVPGVRGAPTEFSRTFVEMSESLGRPIEGVFINPIRLQEVVKQRGGNFDVILNKLLGKDGQAVFAAALKEASSAPKGTTQATLKIEVADFFQHWANLELLNGFGGDITTAKGTLTFREDATLRAAEMQTLFEDLKKFQEADTEWSLDTASPAEAALYKGVVESLRETSEGVEALDEAKVAATVQVHRALARVLSSRSEYSEDELLNAFEFQFKSAVEGVSPAQIERRLLSTRELVREIEENPTGREVQLEAAKEELEVLRRRYAALGFEEVTREIDPSITNKSLLGGVRVAESTEPFATPEEAAKFDEVTAKLDPGITNRSLLMSGLSDETFEFIERLTDTLVENESGEGPSLDSEVVTTPTKEQVHNIKQWETRVRAWMKREGYSKKKIRAHIEGMRGQMAIYLSVGPVEMRFLPRSEVEVRTAWDPDFLKIYDAHDGNLEEVNAEIDKIEDAKTKKKMKAELKKAKDDTPMDWPSELDRLVDATDGDIEAMRKLVAEEKDETLRGRMLRALEAAEKTRERIYKPSPKDEKGRLKGQPPFGPIRKNQDPIYLLSFDLSAMCKKRLEAAATLSLITKRLNEKRAMENMAPRGLNESEITALSNLFKLAGKEAPCLYCYVESARKKVSEFVNIGIDTAFDKSLIKYPVSFRMLQGKMTGFLADGKRAWGESTIKFAEDAIEEMKSLGVEKADLPDPAYWTDINAMQDKELRTQWAQYPALYRWIKSQVQAAKANAPKRYQEYFGQILDLKEDFIREMDKYAGVRFFSSSDFQYEHVADLMQAISDLALRKGRSHAYTKVGDYIEIFGNTNQKIQTSLFAQVPVDLKQDGDEWVAYERDKKGVATKKVLKRGEKDDVLKWLDNYTPPGGFLEDSWQGMGWKKAMKYRRKYEHVGSVFIATSFAQIKWALDQDGSRGKIHIDYIIPYHSSGARKGVFEHLGWIDFTDVQTEKWASKGKKGDPAKIRMHELGAKKGIKDETLTKRYLKLCEERGLEPAFAAFKDHKRFGILQKDYARSDTPFKPTEANFDLKKAKKVLNRFLKASESFKETGDVGAFPDVPMPVADNDITDTMVDMLWAADNGGPDPFALTQDMVSQAPTSAGKVLHQLTAELTDTVVGKVREQSPVEQTKTEAFKKWFGESKVVDENGEPLVVYHGTTADFDVFDKAKANVESDLGGGFYFSNTVEDVEANYSGFGPDLTAKVEREAERIASETDREYDDPSVVAEARERFATHEGATVPVFLKLENPVVLDEDGGTWLDCEETYDEEADEYGEPTGSLVEFIAHLRDVANGREFDDVDPDAVEEIVQVLLDNGMDGGLSALELMHVLDGVDALAYVIDPETGDLAKNELVRQTFEAVGFDGYIDRTVDKKFGSQRRVGKKMSGMTPDTVHYVAFKPEQIKSAIGNRGTFDPDSPSILEQPSRLSQTPRGYMRPVRKGMKKTFEVFLSKQADVSTPLHEMAHAYFEMLHDLVTLPPPNVLKVTDGDSTTYEVRDTFTEKTLRTFDNEAAAEEFIKLNYTQLEGGPQEFRTDYSAVLKWLGKDSWEDLTDEDHEKFARAFEAYLLEGKAPSMQLVGTFAKLRAWLTKIYGTILSLDVDLDDNIRRVFDRMLATDDEIAFMRKAMGRDVPFFPTAKAAGMDAKQFRAYQKEREKDETKEALRAQRLVAQAQHKAFSKEWDNEYKKVREELLKEFEARPDERARLYIRKGILTDETGKHLDGKPEYGGKLNREAVRDIVGKGSPVDRALLSATIVEGGLHPDDVATVFGFKTGKELLEAVAAVPDKNKHVREEALQTTSNNFPELVDELNRAEHLVAKALHMEGTTQALLKEWSMVNAMAKRGPTQRMAAEEHAKNVVGAMNVMSIRPSTALQNEMKYSELSMAEAAKGNMSEAADYKIQQVINHFIYRELLEVKEKREKGIKFMRGMTKDAARKKLGRAAINQESNQSAYLDVIDTLTEMVGLSDARPQEHPRLGVAALVEQMEADGNTITFDPSSLERFLSDPKQLRDMSVDEFMEILNVFQNVGRSTSSTLQVLLDGKKIEKEEAAFMLVQSAQEHLPSLGKISSSNDAGSLLDKTLSTVRSIDARLLRQSTMVNWLAGRDSRDVWHKLILTPLREAEKRERDLLREVMKPIVDSFDNIPLSVRKRLREKIDGRALFPGHNTQRIKPPTRRYELLIMALNVGTKGRVNEKGESDGRGNIERLTEGRGITEEKVMDALKILTLDEWKWVQSVWDANEKLWPLARDLERRMSGLAPDKVPLRPFSITTSDGHEFVSPGGYVPAVYDRRESTNAYVATGQDIGSLMDPFYARPGTSHGHLKGRARKYSDVITLDPSVFQRGIAQVVHDIAFREPLKQVGILILDPTVQETLKEKLGDERSKLFLDWLRAIGTMNGDTALLPPKFLRKIRSNAMTAILGHRVKTMAGDIANCFAAAPRLKKYWLGSYREMYNDPDKWKSLYSKSAFLSTARRTIDTEMEVVSSKLSRSHIFPARVLNAFTDSAWWGFEQTFKLSAYPMWISAFKMNVAENGMTVDEAVTAADDFCTKYYPAQTITDQSAIQRDKGGLGFAMMFFGYMNSVFQVLRDDQQEIQEAWLTTQGHHGQKAWKTAKALPFVIGHSVAFLTMSMVLGELFTGRGPEEDEGEDWGEWYLRKMVSAPFAVLPFVGYGIESLIAGRPVQASVRAAPALSVFEDVLKTMQRLDLAKPESVYAAVRTAGMLVGVPTSPLEQLEYILHDRGLQRDIQQGDPLGIAEGMVYGRHKEWRPANLLSVGAQK